MADWASTEAALQARFTDPLVGFPFYQPTIPYVFDNDGRWEPDAGLHPRWVRWQCLWGLSRQVGIGTGANPPGRRFRTLGLVAVTIYVPRGSGTSLLNTISDQVAAIYRAVDVSGAVCRTPRATPPRLDVNPAWFQGGVLCPFDVDLTI
jgi:hypothetical protein